MSAFGSLDWVREQEGRYEAIHQEALYTAANDHPDFRLEARYAYEAGSYEVLIANLLEALYSVHGVQRRPELPSLDANEHAQ